MENEWTTHVTFLSHLFKKNAEKFRRCCAFNHGGNSHLFGPFKFGINGRRRSIPKIRKVRLRDNHISITQGKPKNHESSIIWRLFSGLEFLSTVSLQQVGTFIFNELFYSFLYLEDKNAQMWQSVKTLFNTLNMFLYGKLHTF